MDSIFDEIEGAIVTYGMGALAVLSEVDPFVILGVALLAVRLSAETIRLIRYARSRRVNFEE